MHKQIHTMTIEGELCAPMASARLVNFHFGEPVDTIMHEASSYRVDMCLTPRPANARGCYPERRGARHFERLGKLFMVPPGESMQAVSDGCCQQTSVLVDFQPDRIDPHLGRELAWNDHTLLAGLDIRQRTIHGLLWRLAEEVRQPGFASETMVELISAQLAIELARYGRGLDDEIRGGLASWRLELIEERLRDLDAAPSLTELADLCQLSVRQLSRGFRASRGCSIGDYVAGVRMERAQQLLTTEQSVKAIALTLGFATPSSFCFAFRRATGATPTEFRAGLRRVH